MEETNLKELGKSWFLLIKNHLKLMSLESALAQISLFPLLISGLALAIFVISFWFLLLGLAGYGLFLLGYKPILCLGALLIINLMAVLMSYMMIQSYKNRMRFPHTRARIKEMLE